jgi:hypothetical protein
MFDTINISGNGNNVDDLLAKQGGETPDTPSPANGSSGADGSSALSDFIEKAFADGKLDDNELKGLKALSGNDGGSKDTSKSGDNGSTPQDFMSQLADIADKSEGFGPGEEKMLDQGKRLMNATPEQRQAFLDKAQSMMDDKDINEKDDKEGSQLESFVDGLLNQGSQSSKNADGAGGAGGSQDKSFMDKVEDLLGQSQDGKGSGPGENMAREAAEMLKDNPQEDQQAFLKELEKLLNNEDGNGDYKKDIDQKNDNEGTILKKMAEAFEEGPSDRSRGTSDSSSSNSDSSSTKGNGAIKEFLNEAKSDGEVSDKDISALRALVHATE